MKKYIFILFAIILFTGCETDAGPAGNDTYNYESELSYDVEFYTDNIYQMAFANKTNGNHKKPETYDSIRFIFKDGEVIFYRVDNLSLPFNPYNMDNWKLEKSGNNRTYTYTITKELEKLAKQ